MDVDALRQARVLCHEVRSVLSASWLQEALCGADAIAQETGTVRLELTIQGSGAVLVRGRLEAVFEVPCARCLEPARVDAGAAVCATYVPGPEESAWPADGEAPLDPDDLERVVYDGRWLDLGPMLAELVAVAYPMRALCPRGEACSGLCAGCGADLNLQGDVTECAECGRPRVGASRAAHAGSSESGQDPAWRKALRKLRDG